MKQGLLKDNTKISVLTYRRDGEKGNSMYNVNNIRILRKVVREMKAGESIYINAICLSQNAIDQLKQYVKEGVLVPDEDRVKREYKVPEDIMSGKYLFPQMVYVKQ